MTSLLNQPFQNISYQARVYLARWTSHWVTPLSASSVPSVVSVSLLSSSSWYSWELEPAITKCPNSGTWISHQELVFLTLPQILLLFFLRGKSYYWASPQPGCSGWTIYPLPCPIALRTSDRLCRYSLKRVPIQAVRVLRSTRLSYSSYWAMIRAWVYMLSDGIFLLC